MGGPATGTRVMCRPRTNIHERTAICPLHCTIESLLLQEVLAAGDKTAPSGAPLRRAAFNLLLFGCRQSGAAFIKWGQWASSRPDLLPEVPLDM